jgi:hypothetical protein
MKIRVDLGTLRRVKIYNADTGEKVGLIQSIEMDMNMAGTSMRFTRGLKANRFLSPWMVGKETPEGLVFDWEAFNYSEVGTA